MRDLLARGEPRNVSFDSVKTPFGRITPEAHELLNAVKGKL